MAYMNDSLWIESKRVAKDNGMADNWLEIVEYYHSLGGHRAMVHSIIDEKQREILHILDTEEILLIDSDGNLHVEDYETVLSSKKLFFYKTNDTHNDVSMVLPEGKTYLNKKTVNVKVV